MIDMIWIAKNKIEYVIEVENSTKFTSGVQRASNLDLLIPKIMVIPDYRTKEFLGTNDPLFKDNFKSYNWSYSLYSEIEALYKIKKINKSVLDKYMNRIK